MKKTLMLCALAALSAPAHATVISGSFNAVVYDSFSDVSGAGLLVGEVVTGSFRYDTSAGNLYDSASEDHFGYWRDVGFDDDWIQIEYSVGGASYNVDPSELGAYTSTDFVYIEDDYKDRDHMQIVDRKYYTGGSDMANLVIYDWVNDILTGDSLMQSFDWNGSSAVVDCGVHSVSSLQCGRFVGWERDDVLGFEHEIHAYVTSVSLNYNQVPLPATLLLMATGVLGLRFIKRK